MVCRGKVQSFEGPSKGMVVDFGDIKEVYRRHIEPYVEHQDLNETLELPEYTTEHIARWIFDAMHPHLPTLYSIKLWEGKTSYVLYRDEDRLR